MRKAFIYGRRKEWDLLSVGFPGLSFLEKWEDISWLCCRIELTCPEACSSHSTGTFFAVGTRGHSFQSLEAISRVLPATRERTECSGEGPEWSLRGEWTQLVTTKNYPGWVPLRWLQFSIGSDPQDPDRMPLLSWEQCSMGKRVETGTFLNYRKAPYGDKSLRTLPRNRKVPLRGVSL